MDNLIIRKAIPDDAENILAFLNQVGGETDNLLFGLNEFIMPIKQEQEYIESINNSNNSIMLIGIIDNEIASVASIQGFSRKRIAHRGNIAVSVKKVFWHQGIGKKMMMELIKFAKEASITVVELEVKSDNHGAIALYEGLGFERIGTYNKFFYIDGRYYDAYLMNLYL